MIEFATIAAELGGAVFGIGVGGFALVLAWDIMRDWRG
jgi:hypothetical protein